MVVSCDICNNTYMRHHDMVRHKRKHNPERLNCQYCNYQHYNTSCLRRHIMNKHRNIKNKVKEDKTNFDKLLTEFKSNCFENSSDNNVIWLLPLNIYDYKTFLKLTDFEKFVEHMMSYIKMLCNQTGNQYTVQTRIELVHNVIYCNEFIIKKDSEINSLKLIQDMDCMILKIIQKEFMHGMSWLIRRIKRISFLISYSI